MADNENSPSVVAEEAVDFDMEAPAADTPGDVEVTGEGAVENPLPFAADEEEDVKVPTRQTYIDYLSSPIVKLHVGEQHVTVLRAHQALLVQSPWFAETCAQFGSATTVSSLHFPHVEVEAH